MLVTHLISIIFFLRFSCARFDIEKKYFANFYKEVGFENKEKQRDWLMLCEGKIRRAEKLAALRGLLVPQSQAAKASVLIA